MPNIARIKQAVKNAFSADPRDEALRQSLAGEGGHLWVLNGTSDSTRGPALAAYLEYHGLAASAPRGRPKGSVPSDTVITVYNGAEEKLAATIAYLEKTFDVQVKTKTDPTIPVDVVITVGRNTPNLQAPPSS